MTLKASQRNRLPDSAFAYPASRKYPMPTAIQARKAGISESQRQALFKSAAALSAKKSTMGQPSVIAKVTRNRQAARGRQGGASRRRSR